MGLALYRKYRSRSLDEVVGQEHVTDLLRRAIEQGRVGHAYLFTGPKGVGKTSIARIVAHQLNNLPYGDSTTHLDIIEIDAASNNGVEDIRDLRDRVQIAPVSAPKKVYIIDEVHMLSKPAFNALLKTLEEPPEHVVFILATTDIDKVPETIKSRTQRFTFRRASKPAIIKNLQRIAKAEQVTVADDALEVVADHSDGSFRDSVSLFDQLLSSTTDPTSLKKQDVLDSLGLAPEEAISKLLEDVENGHIESIDQTLKSLEDSGVPARLIASQLSASIRRKLSSKPSLLPLLDNLIDVSKSTVPSIKLLTTLCLHSPQSPHGQIYHAPPPPRPAPSEPTKPVVEPKSTTKPQPEATKSKPSPSPVTKKMPAAGNTASFVWDDYVGYVRQHHVAIHSVLAKCQHDVDGSTLYLYARTPFYKKKLDDTKYRALLISSLEAIGCHEIEIETLPTTKPPKDSSAAKVAAMMGGGEEISFEEQT